MTTTKLPLTLQNYDPNATDENGNPIKQGYSIAEFAQIHKELLDSIDLINVNGQLYGIRHEKAQILKSTDDVVAFLMVHENLKFQFAKSEGCFTKSEFVKALPQYVKQYELIAEYPHEPSIETIYYLKNLKPKHTGALEQFLDYCYPATDYDRMLIKSILLTCFWGGDGGQRPAYTISAENEDDDSQQGRGAGKSFLTERISTVCGQTLDFNMSEGSQQFYKRIFASPEARIYRFDNVKSRGGGKGMSNQDIEKMITAEYISGYQNYTAAGRIPNFAVWLFTINEASYSKDLASRAVPVKLARVDNSKADAQGFVDFCKERKEEIIADILSELSQPIKHTIECPSVYRWRTWVDQILARITDDQGCMDYIIANQQAQDSDQYHAEIILEGMSLVKYLIIQQQHGNASTATEHSLVFFPSGLLHQLYKAGKPNIRDTDIMDTSHLARKLNQSNSKILVRHRTSYQRGYFYLPSESSDISNFSNAYFVKRFNVFTGEVDVEDRDLN